MAKNFVQDGDVLFLTAPYTRTSGQGAKIGSLFGVAMVDVLNGASANWAIEGVFTLDKSTGASTGWATAGGKVYWDDTAKACTAVVGSNLIIGHATAAAADGAALVNVRLSGASG